MALLYEDVARIALDIDSTLHHYWDVLQRVVRERYGLELPYEEQFEWGISALERDAVIHCVEETHSDENIAAGVPYDGAIETVREWHEAGHWIHVTSHRRAASADATARWLDQIGLPYDDLHCSFDKISRCRELRIDVLVDDSPVNITRARDAGILPATIIHPWNEELVASDGVIGARDWAGPIIHPWNEELVASDGVIGARDWAGLREQLAPILDQPA